MDAATATDWILIIEILILAVQATIAWALFSFGRSQYSIQMKTQRTLRIHEWGNKCIDLLSEADHYCMLTPKPVGDKEHLRQKYELLRCLSSQIDQGRMLFENINKEDFGTEKHPAYRGYRPKILDPLIAAYLAINAVDQSEELLENQTKDRLLDWRRYFVSLLQKEVHPDWLKKATSYGDEAGGGVGYSINEDSRAPYDI